MSSRSTTYVQASSARKLTETGSIVRLLESMWKSELTIPADSGGDFGAVVTFSMRKGRMM